MANQMSNAIKNIAVLGSTGSIGQQTLDIVRNFPDKFKIIGLSGGENINLLNQQINEFKPKFVYSKCKVNISYNISLLSMEEIASHPDIDLVVIAVTGIVGLAPTLAAIKASKKIALANKEVIVAAGKIIMTEAKRYRAKLLPVDSEHSAIWQCLRGERSRISRLILTASGGSFYRYPVHRLDKVTVEDALQHPNWKMGGKITIDSATLMNKGLEAIEAQWLFAIPLNKIEIVIHPKSIIHSLVEFMDGSVKAQMSFPDMHLPIQYALSYPGRLPVANLPLFDLAKINSLTFEAIDYEYFPCLTLALESGKKGGTYPSVLCAADEIAVELFLSRQLKFTNIAEIIADTLDLHQNIEDPNLDQIIAADKWARKTASQIARKRSLC
jgi:1-deoxy-D-xylulose-5-phosphate reductoisomerase